MGDYSLELAQYKNAIWKLGCQLQRALRCELNSVYYLCEHWVEKGKFDKAEKCMECLQVLEHPQAYTMCGLQYEGIANEYGIKSEKRNGEWAKEKEKVYQDKALEMFKLAYERQEKDVDYYYAQYLVECDKKEEALKVFEQIASDRKNKRYRKAKKYVKREKTRASFLGKFNISAFGFFEKPLIHIIYLLIIWYFFDRNGLYALIGMIWFAVAKIKGIRISMIKSDFDFMRLQIGGDKIYETSLFNDIPPFQKEEEFVTSKTYNGYGVKVGESYDKIGWEYAYIDFTESIEAETLKIREQKKAGFIQRAERGDKKAVEALKYFYGMYYEDGNITEGEVLLGLTPEYLDDLYYKGKAW